MSSTITLVVVCPILVGCLWAAGVDIAARIRGGAATPTPVVDLAIAARIHGGAATPTPVVDLAIAAGHAARVALIAIPAALIAGVIRGDRA